MRGSGKISAGFFQNHVGYLKKKTRLLGERTQQKTATFVFCSENGSKLKDVCQVAPFQVRVVRLFLSLTQNKMADRKRKRKLSAKHVAELATCISADNMESIAQRSVRVSRHEFSDKNKYEQATWTTNLPCAYCTTQYIP